MRRAINVLAFRNSSEIMLCFVKKVLQRFMSSTLMPHTNALAVRGPTLNDVEGFRNGSLIHEFKSYKASQIYAKFILVLTR